jgi:hypothetical protein
MEDKYGAEVDFNTFCYDWLGSDVSANT